MRMTQDVRDDAAEHGLDSEEAIERLFSRVWRRSRRVREHGTGVPADRPVITFRSRRAVRRRCGYRRSPDRTLAVGRYSGQSGPAPCWGCTAVAVTAVTVQNSLGVKGFHKVPGDVIAAQIEVVCHDIGMQAAKTGMLASAEIITAVAESWREHRAGVPLVVDPVCASMMAIRCSTAARWIPFAPNCFRWQHW